MKMLPKNPDPFDLKGCYLAGGAILSTVRREEPNDYDYYFKNKQALVDAIFHLADNNCFLLNVSDRAITFKSNDVKNEKGERAIIQLCIGDFYNLPEEIFNSFDFSTVMSAFDCDTKKYTFHEDFWPSVTQKRILFNPGTNWPIASLLRAKKYIDKGFSISKREYLKMSMAILNRGLPTSWNDLSLQIGGFYGKQIKIDNQGLEFTYENVLKVIEDIDFEAYALNTDEPISFDIESFAELLEKNTIIYVPIKTMNNKYDLGDVLNRERALIVYFNGDEWFVDQCVDLPVIELIRDVSKDISLIEMNNLNLSVTKYLIDKDGDLYSGIHTYNAKKYKIGEVTECYESPFLFSWPSKKRSPGYMTNKNGHFYKAIVNTADIRLMMTGEIQSTKLKIISKLEETKNES